MVIPERKWRKDNEITVLPPDFVNIIDLRRESLLGYRCTDEWASRVICAVDEIKSLLTGEMEAWLVSEKLRINLQHESFRLDTRRDILSADIYWLL